MERQTNDEPTGCMEQCQYLLVPIEADMMTSSNGSISVLLALCTGIHRSPGNSPHKGQWCIALMFSLICAWINGWINNGEAGDLRHHPAHYDVIAMEGKNILDSFITLLMCGSFTLTDHKVTITNEISKHTLCLNVHFILYDDFFFMLAFPKPMQFNMDTASYPKDQIQ